MAQVDWDFWNTSLTFGTEANPVRGVETVPSTAVQSMTPVNNGDSGWTGLFQDIVKGVVGYAVAKDAQQSGTKPPQVVYATAPATATAQPSSNGMVLLLVVGVVVVLALNAGGK